MGVIGLLILLVLVIAVFGWTCQTSLEPFVDSESQSQAKTEARILGETEQYDMKMKPWFGYEPGRYGPGWGRTGCSRAPSCTDV